MPGFFSDFAYIFFVKAQLPGLRRTEGGLRNNACAVGNGSQQNGIVCVSNREGDIFPSLGNILQFVYKSTSVGAFVYLGNDNLVSGGRDAGTRSSSTGT